MNLPGETLLEFLLASEVELLADGELSEQQCV
jgi:hypothetical protein